MKKLFAFSLLLAGILLTVAGCDLFNGINLAWNIESVTWSNPNVHVMYSVRNLGKYDLTGVNLQFGVDMYGNGTYLVTAWTKDFSIGQNQVLFASIDIRTGTPPAGDVTVLSVDMDKPGN